MRRRKLLSRTLAPILVTVVVVIMITASPLYQCHSDYGNTPRTSTSQSLPKSGDAFWGNYDRLSETFRQNLTRGLVKDVLRILHSRNASLGLVDNSILNSNDTIDEIKTIISRSSNGRQNDDDTHGGEASINDTPNSNSTQKPTVPPPKLINEEVRNYVLPNGSFDVEKFLAEPILNPFEVTYRINQPITYCPKNTHVLIAVPSSLHHFGNRLRVRKSEHSKYANEPQNRAKIVFFLGSPHPNMSFDEITTLQRRIDQESGTYGDIIQANFVDSYRNLTKKASLLLHWASTFCKDADLFLRTDDDIRLIDIPAVLTSMEQKSASYEHYMLGRLAPFRNPVHDPNSKHRKYLVPLEQWATDHKYPPFLLGGSYGFPMKTAGLLLAAMRRTKFLWLDDVFVTGICANRLGIPVFHDQRFVFRHWQ